MSQYLTGGESQIGLESSDHTTFRGFAIPLEAKMNLKGILMNWETWQ